MPTKLSVFNDALGMLGQTVLDDADQTGEDGDTLRGHWTATVEYCHEKTGWNFAKTREELARSGTTPDHGYDYYYTLPATLMRLIYITQSGLPHDPLLDYENEDGKIATDAETVYITYVSSATVTTPGDWTNAFAHYVAAELARRAAPKINPSKEEKIDKEVRRAMSDAIGFDATQEPPKRRPMGSWSLAARGLGTNNEQGR